MQHENSTFEELVCTLELLQKSCTNPSSSKLDLTHIIRFRELLGTALAQIPCSKYSGGYAWLADDLTTYQGRVGTAVGHPDMPTRPAEVPATATSSEYKQYKRDLKHYLYCEKIRTAALGIIEHKFPGELELKKTRLGLPLNFTIQNAFQHLEAEHGSELNRTETTLRIQKNVMTRAYIHSSGCTAFLKGLEIDKEDVEILGTSEITYAHLIMCAQQAFRNTLKKATIRDIDKEWKDEKSRLNIQRDDKPTWNRFMLFYANAFKEKEEDGILTDSRARAKSAVELSDMKAIMEDQADAMEALHSAFNAMVTDGKVPGTIDKPRVDDAATALTESTMTHADIVKIIQSVNNETNKNKKRHTPRDHGTKTNTWRQWKHFCHTHGVNLNHASGDCPRPNEGHKNEATKCSPCGGNEKRNHLWMKWCDPVSLDACDTPGE